MRVLRGLGKCSEARESAQGGWEIAQRLLRILRGLGECSGARESAQALDTAQELR
jgi:hypothetical protein